jgi:tRNA (guanine37-N1)-methyltransferase
MKFNIVTIFPKIFDSYFSESIIKRASQKGLFEVEITNLRDFTQDKHKTVDDTPYGGGAGMVLKIEPIFKCINYIKSEIRNPKSETNFLPKADQPSAEKSKIKNSKKLKSRTILFSAKGKRYTQKDAKRLLKYDNLILICGRYEGVDERVAQYIADEEISVGDYVLTGGEIPAMVVVDSVVRLIPGVLGNSESAKDESHSKENILEYPQYTKPEEFQGWKVPKILLGGNHQKIKEWRNKNSKIRKK